MANGDRTPSLDRARLGWWLLVTALALLAGYVAYSFLGLLALGIFGYYATRPINRRVSRVVDSDGVAAWVTILLVMLPMVAVLAYGGFRLYQQARSLLTDSGDPLVGLLDALPEAQQEAIEQALRNPQQLVSDPQQAIETIGMVSSAFFGALLLLGLAVTLTFFLLANDHAIAAGIRELVGGEDTTAWAYATAVDNDLQSVFFGNFLFVVAMAVIAAVVYTLTNLLAPAGLAVPSVLVLAFLTGVTSLIPLVVSKVIYVPVLGYLALQASEGGSEAFLAVGVVAVVYFLVLDLLPQTFLQPYITGRQLGTVVMMFGYLLGPILFGWHGVIVLPILFLLMLEAIRIVLPQLVRGEPLTTTVSMAESMGGEPQTSGAASGGAERPPGENGGQTGSDGRTSGGEDDSEETPEGT